MPPFLRNLSLNAKITLVTTLLMLTLTAVVTTVTITVVEREMHDQAQARQESNMRVAWQVLKTKGAEFQIRDGALFAGSYKVNGDNEVVDRIKELVGGTATVFMNDTRVSTNVIKADGKRAVGTKLAHGPVYDSVFKSKKPFRGVADILGATYFTAYDPILNAGGKVVGVLYVGLKQSEFYDLIGQVATKLVIAAILTGLILIAMLFFVVRKQINALGGIVAAVERLRMKDYSVTVVGRERHDEIGTLARAVDTFKDAMIEADRAVDEQRQTLEKRAARTRRIAELCAGFESKATDAVSAVTSSAEEMMFSAENMAKLASTAERQSGSVAEAADRATANVSTVAVSAEQVANAINEIREQVERSSSTASAATQQAKDTNAQVQGLAAAANEIGQVIQLITDIAAQTNLLALNATIEAARAGEAGKGFAVVASEVKNLANQTATATDKIAQQVDGIQRSTTDAVAAIERITDTIGAIDEISGSIATSVEEESEAIREIARNVESSAADNQQISVGIGTVSTAAADTSAAVSSVRQASETVLSQAEALRAEVEAFLAEIRKA